ncbi:MAG: tripartite tricarboxylate transporter TctB family protein [Chromatiales bacterium]|nr:tripartite tricarboxylate transporter TctB family protein [Chromatiales bacterium]
MPISPIKTMALGLMMLGAVPAFAQAPPAALPDAGDFPRQPIRIIVYTSPGGLIDFTARRFAEIARRHAPEQPFIVINRPGGGGIVAFEEVLQQPADGHHMLAVTRSNISKMVATGRDDLIERIDWHSYIMENPHVVITNSARGAGSWDEVYREALAAGDRQLWLGADIGGVKHVSGVKIARAAGIDMRWIPYSSGGEAMAALLGNLGTVYLGNPRDALASPDLRVVAVAGPERLSAFPDAPTFAELGIPGLENEHIWRGFAFRQGMPEEVRDWYTALIRKVTSDPDWIAGWANEAVVLGYRSSEEFGRMVARDQAEFAFYLREMGLLREPGSRETLLAGIGEAPAVHFLQALLVILNVVLALALLRSSFRHRFGELMILSVVTSLAIVFYAMSSALPPPNPVDRVGASGIPRLWIALLLPLALWQTWLILRQKKDPMHKKKPLLLFGFLGFMSCYVLLIPILGYLLASLVYLPGILWYLKYRKPVMIGALTAGWLLFSWFVFQETLFVDLPRGALLPALMRGLG